MRSSVWWTSRRTARTAAVGAAVLVMGLLAAAGPAAGEQTAGAQPGGETDDQLAYTCGFPSGERPIDVQVAATFPDSTMVDQPIQPTDVTVTATLPEAALADLTRLGAATVAATAELTVAVSHGGRSTDAIWSGLAAPRTAIPETGELALPASGAVPPVTVSESGDVTFTAADLRLVLTPKKADGTATDPATVPVACALDPGQTATLATVPVTGTATAGPTTHLPSSTPIQPTPTTPFGQRLGQPGTAPDGAIAVGPTLGRAKAPGSAQLRNTDDIPPGCDTTLVPISDAGGCAFLAGYSNVNKLNGSTLVGPGPLNSAGQHVPEAAFLNISPYDGGTGCVPPAPTVAECLANGGVTHAFLCTAALPNYQGRPAFPPGRATFLAFGFMPVTATMQLTAVEWPEGNEPREDPRCASFFGRPIHEPITLESPIIHIFSDLPFFTDPGQESTAETYMSIRLFDVIVNGEALDVGPHCQTARSMHVILRGEGQSINPPPTGYTVAFGGPLTGTVTIPPFSGCGVNEDLDPLLTSTISGPGNFLKMTQGRLCAATNPRKPGCPPTIPVPER